MALDIYFREDIANILTGHLMARPEWRECLEAVGRSVGVNLLRQDYRMMEEVKYAIKLSNDSQS